MKSEIKERWVEALQGGEYEQGQGYLNKGGKFCCLGVLCDILGEPWVMGSESYSLTNGHIGTLPGEIRMRLDMDYDATIHLMEMNDKGKTFEEIADYIKENL